MAATDAVLEEIVLTRLVRLNATAQGLVLGTLAGLAIFVATNWLIDPHLALLGQFFVGYQVTFLGRLIGFGYGLVTGFVVGYAVATLYKWFGVKRETRRERSKPA